MCFLRNIIDKCLAFQICIKVMGKIVRDALVDDGTSLNI